MTRLCLFCLALIVGPACAEPADEYPGGMPSTPQDELPALTHILRGGDWNERIHAVHELGAMGAPAVDALSDGLDDPDWQVRFTAVHFLGRIGKPAIEALARAMREEPCRIVRISALHWLGSLGDAGLEAVKEGLQDESGVMRLYAEYWLRKPEGLSEGPRDPLINPEEDLNVCSSSLTPGFKKRLEAYHIEGKGKAEEREEAASEPEAEKAKTDVQAPPEPAEALQEDSPQEPPEAAIPRAAPRASDAALPRDSARSVALEPADRYKEIDELLSGDGVHPALEPRKPAQPPLPTAEAPPKGAPASVNLDDGGALLEREEPEPGVIAKAQRPGKESLPTPPAVEVRGSPQIQADGVLMADAGAPKPYDAVPGLMNSLKSGDSKTRSRAADELGKMGRSAGRAVPALRELMGDPNARVRASAALALGNIGPAADPAVNVLIRALGDHSAAVRYSAAVALSRIGTPSAQKAFNRYLRKEARESLRTPPEPEGRPQKPHF